MSFVIKELMKLHLKILFLFSLISLVSLGQYDSEGDLKSRFRPGFMWFNTGLRPAKIDKVRKYDRLMFDVTYNDWVGERKTFQMQGPSLGMNVSWLFEIPLVKKNSISFAIGPNYGFYKLRHDLPTIFNQNNHSIEFGNESDIGYFGKRKLIGHQISVPIEFRFRTKGWKHYKFHVGGKIGYQLALNEKARFDHLGEEIVKKSKYEDVNRLIYSIHARIGIRNLAFFGSYNINPFFKNDNSTELHLLQLGLTISLF